MSRIILLLRITHTCVMYSLMRPTTKAWTEADEKADTIPAPPNQYCCWCRGPARDDCDHGVGTMARVAQANVERWLRESPKDADAVIAIMLADDLKAVGQ